VKGSPRRRGPSAARRRELLDGLGVAFLASQVGAHSSRQWNERLRSAGLDSRQVLLFWNVAVSEGRSQRELARTLRLPASRVVGLVDALEARGVVERRTNSSDRRERTLYLTANGRKLLDRVMTISDEHERALTRGLSAADRVALVKLLSKLASKQGLGARTHPDT
jgi:DNA-binding MarR family transcriptional regulator